MSDEKKKVVAFDKALTHIADAVKNTEYRPTLNHLCVRKGKAIVSDGFVWVEVGMPIIPNGVGDGLVTDQDDGDVMVPLSTVRRLKTRLSKKIPLAWLKRGDDMTHVVTMEESVGFTIDPMISSFPAPDLFTAEGTGWVVLNAELLHRVATVFAKLAPGKNDTGAVRVVLRGPNRIVEFQAMTDDDRMIRVGLMPMIFGESDAKAPHWDRFDPPAVATEEVEEVEEAPVVA